MASNLLLILLLVVASLSITYGYALSTRDDVSKQDDKSYVIATSDHGSSMIVVEDLVKARSLQVLHAGSKVVVIKKDSKSSSSKSTKGTKKKHKSKKIGSLPVAAFVVIIIAAVVVTIVIICVIHFYYVIHKIKKDQILRERTSKTDWSK